MFGSKVQTENSNRITIKPFQRGNLHNNGQYIHCDTCKLYTKTMSFTQFQFNRIVLMQYKLESDYQFRGQNGIRAGGELNKTFAAPLQYGGKGIAAASSIMLSVPTYAIMISYTVTAMFIYQMECIPFHCTKMNCGHGSLCSF